MPFICNLSAIDLPFIHHLAYSLSFRRAMDSHLLVVPGVSTCFGSEAKMNSRHHVSIPKFVSVASPRPGVEAAVICKLRTAVPLKG